MGERSDVGPPLPRRLLGDRYELLGELGRGAAGAVYKAYDRVAGEVVAIKVLARSTGGETLERIRRELRAARLVTHPGVVRLHDVMTADGVTALTMELVEGETLEAVLARDHRLDGRRLLALLRDLAIAVSAAHRAGVVHRDLKPANIILRRSNGRPVVTDFGISRIAADRTAVRTGTASPGSGASDLTEEGLLLGTPLYMAPEQLEPNADVGPAADVFALGLVAWEAATGSPLDGGSSLEQLFRIRGAERALDLHAVRPDLSPALCAVVARCLRHSASDRFPSATELRAALDAVDREGAADAPGRSGRRSGRLVVAASFGALAVVVGVAVWGRSPVAAPRGDAAPRGETASAAATASAAPWRARMRQLSAREQNLDRPALSPDGRSIVVPSMQGGHWDVWRFDVERDDWRALTNDAAFDAAPVFVERGRAVAFYSERDGRRGIFRLSLDDPGPPEFLQAAVYVNLGAPRDGGRVFFSRDEHGVWMYDVEARRSTELVSLGDGVRVLGLSSDEAGERVVASVQRHPSEVRQSPESANDLYVLNVAERRGDYVTNDAQWHGTAAFVPGAPAVLVSSSRRGGQLNLWKIHVDGSAPTQLTAGSGDDIYAFPTWDGKALLYAHDQTVRQLFRRAPHASSWTRLTHEVLDHQEPSFEPRSGRLVFTTYDRDRDVRAAWQAVPSSPDPIRALPLPVAPVAVRLLAQGERALVLASKAGRDDLVLIAGDAPPAVVAADLQGTGAFTVSADEARVAFVEKSTARFVSLPPAAPRPVEPISGVRAIDFSPKRAGEVALVRSVGPGTASVEIVDLDAGTAKALARCPESTRVTWTPDGDSIWVVPSLEPTLRRIDPRDGRTLESIPSAGDNTLSLAVAADGSVVAEATLGQTRLLWLEDLEASP